MCEPECSRTSSILWASLHFFFSIFSKLQTLTEKPNEKKRHEVSFVEGVGWDLPKCLPEFDGKQGD